MNRLLLMFIVAFAGFFGGTYVLMQRGKEAAAGSAPEPVVKPADTDASPANDQGSKSPSPTSASSPDEGKSPTPKAPSSPPANDNEDKKDLEIAATPKLAQASAQTFQKQKKRVYKRAPAKRDELPDNPRDEDLAKLQGTWQVVNAEHEQSSDTREEAKKYKWEFQGNKYTIKCNDKFAELWAVNLASSRKPKAIDGTHDLTGQKLMGIYDISGDTLKVCYDLTGRGRPDNFTTPKGSKHVCYILQRQ